MLKIIFLLNILWKLLYIVIKHAKDEQHSFDKILVTYIALLSLLISLMPLLNKY